MTCPLCLLRDPHCKLCSVLAESSPEDALELAIALQKAAGSLYQEGVDCAAMADYATYVARRLRGAALS